MIPHRQHRVLVRAAATATLALAASVHAGPPAVVETTLVASRDVTLIENPTGARANSLGVNIFCGRTNQSPGVSIRRSLIAFDVADAVPEGATIVAASLELFVTDANPGAVPARLHRVLADWSEGTSDPPGNGGSGVPSEPGDPTWLHRSFPDVFWAAPGGDVARTPSAIIAIDQPAVATWRSTPALVADVQSWLDDPAQNHGWSLMTDEASGGTTKRFASRDAPETALHPRLHLVYRIGPLPSADLDADGTVGLGDLLVLLSSFGASCDAGCPADLDDDGDVDVVDLSVLLAAWG